MGSCCSSTERVEPVGQEETELNRKGKGSPAVSLQDGPVKNRGCTDVIFLILFLAFVGGLAYLLVYSVKHGDIYRLINGYDNCGNICGRQNENTKNKCSNSDKKLEKILTIEKLGTTSKDEQNINRYCAKECDTAKNRKIGNRCFVGAQLNQFSSRTGLADFLQEVSEDLDTCQMEILYLCLIAFGFAIVMLILFRFLVGIVVWIILIGAMIASVAGTVFLWLLWKRKKKEMEEGTKDMEINTRSVKSYLAYAIVATISTVIIWLVIIVMRKRIKLVVQLFREAGKAVGSMPFILLQPFITFISLACIVAVWLYFCLWIESAGEFNEKAKITSAGGAIEIPWAHYEKDTTIKVARWYNLFALFWFAQFCIGCQHIVIAGAVAKWFFTRNKDHLGVPILRSYWNLVRYHLGSVALGSLIIALVQMVRVVLKFIESQLKGRENVILQCMFKTCHCCLWCFEKILQFLTRNAYIEIATHGYSFCKAGRKAFTLLASNALRVAAINSVGDFVLFLGKAIVVTATVLIGTTMLEEKEGLQHKWVPLVLVGLFAYLVSHSFLTVYEMAIDTIFLCFCEDCEQNDGLSRPYFMSRGLMEFVQNSKKALAVHDASSAPSQAWSSSSHQPAK